VREAAYDRKNRALPGQVSAVARTIAATAENLTLLNNLLRAAGLPNDEPERKLAA
jgi:hypothetical protein